MVVHNFNLMRPILTPSKAHPPMIVNTDAMLPLAVALEGFELVSWGNPETRQLGGGMQLQELTLCHPFDVSESGYDLALEKRLGFRACY